LLFAKKPPVLDGWETENNPPPETLLLLAGITNDARDDREAIPPVVVGPFSS